MRTPSLKSSRFQSWVIKNCCDLDGRLKGLCFSGRLRESVEILCQKRSIVDPQTYAFLLQECINLKDFKKGRRIHSQMVTSGFIPDEYLTTKLLILYVKNGDLETAHQLFDRMPQRSLVSRNALISGFVQKGREEEALDLYYDMRLSGLMPDQFTFASVFRACARLARLEQGRQIHGNFIKSRINANLVVNSALVDMYFKCSSVDDARQVFDNLSERNIVTWTALITGYGQHGQVAEVFSLFQEMVNVGIRPNHVTFLAVLCACSHGGLVKEGWRYFNSMKIDYGISPRAEHCAAMVDLLGRVGRIDEAYEFVRSLPFVGHSVIWGSLLGACRIHGQLELAKLAAKKLFKLQPENVGKYVVLSNAYAALGLWENVAEIREMMSKNGMRKEPGCSWIEVQRKRHCFLAGDEYHEHINHIYEMIRELTGLLKEAGYLPDLSLHDK